ncbi:hypothetical protein [Clostridium tertium]|uniref:hypothetical protein n=1 Tax=Clostridium tertium TaxID=1559 RepID=UPI00232B9A9C|nr:hypothetical protein [Clostridium tertium]MDB1940079.1 hypothetical protein [Clostridium tertium]
MDAIDNSIYDTLKGLNVNKDMISENIFNYLRKIETEFHLFFSKQEKLNKDIRNNKPTMVRISNNTKISRQTFFNNSILKDYVTFRTSQFNEKFNLNSLTNTSKKVNELEEIIKKMSIRDANEELFKRTISELENEIITMKKNYDEITHKYYKLLSKFKNNYIESDTSNSNVINLNSSLN